MWRTLRITYTSHSHLIITLPIYLFIAVHATLASQNFSRYSVNSDQCDRVILGRVKLPSALSPTIPQHRRSYEQTIFSCLIPLLTQLHRPLTSKSSIMPWTNTRSALKLIYSHIPSPPSSDLAILAVLFSQFFNSNSRARVSPKVLTNAGQDGLTQP